MKTFNCLADQELREGIKEYRLVLLHGNPLVKLRANERLVIGRLSLKCTSKANS